MLPFKIRTITITPERFKQILSDTRTDAILLDLDKNKFINKKFILSNPSAWTNPKNEIYSYIQTHPDDFEDVIEIILKV